MYYHAHIIFELTVYINFGSTTTQYRTVEHLAFLYGEYSTVCCFDPPTQNSL